MDHAHDMALLGRSVWERRDGHVIALQMQIATCLQICCFGISGQAGANDFKVKMMNGPTL